MAKLFGTNGIRGVFGEDLTLDFISKITLSLASFFKKGPILVGYDGRESSVAISKIVTAALSSAGLDSAICGLVPTPCLQFATRQLGYNGGIMITASHNPPQYNGLKVIANDGIEISRESELLVEQFYFAKKWRTAKKFGSITKESDAINTYLSGIKKRVNVGKIRSQKLKIVLDLGNGAQAVTAPTLCKELGCETVLINEKIDGNFSGRGSEPTPQNLDKLSDMIIKSKADLGIAFDGDGDRSIFCDEFGKILTGDRSALLLSKYIIKKQPQSKIVTSVNSTSVIEKIAAESQSHVLRTRVGSVEVSRKMVEENAIIGFEENGGFMYGKHNQVRDGSMTMAILLDLLASSKNSLSQEMDALPPSFTTKGKIECSRDDFKKIVKILKTEPYKKDLTDGIKLSLDDSSWIMVRLSGTEPIARIYAESSSQSKLDEIFAKYMQKVKTTLDR
ncbi:Phosphomannomutase [Candidatus Nitrosotalea sp. FS]|uniref:phosphoglucosamine mutase n=1 Tax=Candidatus Nitrosotalea sp. FS TaxID=2341021 RepID=UPI00140BEE7C|nr:phosphoglucosamine mutase [Candidatus Nitrosotalea sp. FS]NHH98118.1 Phosphomannomutase [Candidatus Nitrosotalea sp. FS]